MIGTIVVKDTENENRDLTVDIITSLPDGIVHWAYIRELNKFIVVRLIGENDENEEYQRTC